MWKLNNSLGIWTHYSDLISSEGLQILTALIECKCRNYKWYPTFPEEIFIFSEVIHFLKSKRTAHLHTYNHGSLHVMHVYVYVKKIVHITVMLYLVYHTYNHFLRTINRSLFALLHAFRNIKAFFSKLSYSSLYSILCIFKEWRNTL